jgi:hypothetical protein
MKILLKQLYSNFQFFLFLIYVLFSTCSFMPSASVLLMEVTSLNWWLRSHSFLVVVQVCTFLTVRSSDFTQTVHIYIVHIYTDSTHLRILNTAFKDVKLRRVSLTIHLPLLHIWAWQCVVCNVSHLRASRKHWQLQWRFERMYRTRSTNVEMFQ